MSDSGPMPRSGESDAVQHVVAAFELARGFDAHDVVRLLHHADHVRIAVGFAAVLAQLAVADVVADAAEAQLVLDVEDRLGQVLGVLAAGAQHVEGEALRGFLPDAGQALEFGDEPRERFGEIGHRSEQAGGQAHAAEHAAHLLFDLARPPS